MLDLRDLPLTPAEEQALADSLVAYRKGDLLAALANYPAARPPGSEAEQVYHAALLLAVGQVDKTQSLLAALPAADADGRIPRLAGALRASCTGVHPRC